MIKWNWLRWPWVIPLVVFAILIYLGANTHTLWSDEAQTALLARSINQYGLPKGFDGVNIFGYQGAALLDHNLIDHNVPWLQYYLSALSFRLFGESSFTARLPFMLFSLGSIPLIFYLTLRLTKNRFTSVLAVIFASLSVQFILYSFQARYYSLTVFFGLLFLYSSLGLKEGKLKTKILFVISALGYLYSHYLMFMVLYLSLFLVLPVFCKLEGIYKEEIMRLLKKYLLLGAIAFFCFLPWFLILNPSDSKMSLTSVAIGEIPMYFLSYTAHSLIRYNDANVFPIVLFFLLVCIIFNNRKKLSKIRPIIFLSLLFFIYYLIIVTISTLLSFSLATLTDGRYHVLMVAVLIILAATIFERIRVWNKTIFVLLILIFLLSNLLSFNAPRSLLWDYLTEIKNSYPSPDLVVAKYLRENAR